MDNTLLLLFTQRNIFYPFNLIEIENRYFIVPNSMGIKHGLFLSN